MTTPRRLILDAVKTVEPDARRALAIADLIAADWRRHPQQKESYSVPVAGELRLLPPQHSPVLHGAYIGVRIKHVRTRLKVEAAVVRPTLGQTLTLEQWLAMNALKQQAERFREDAKLDGTEPDPQT